MYEGSREKPPFGESINFCSEMIQKAPMENCAVVAAPFNKSLYFNFDLAQNALVPWDRNSSRRMIAKRLAAPWDQKLNTATARSCTSFAKATNNITENVSAPLQMRKSQ